MAKALLGKADNPDENIFENASVKSIKRTIDIANRFMVHLKAKCPTTILRSLSLRRLTRVLFKEHAAALDLDDEDSENGQYIPPEDGTLS